MKDAILFIIADGLLLVFLFYVVTMIVALLQQQASLSGLTERLRNASLFRGAVAATVAGAVTPFCSCSTIPVFSGMLRAQIRFGTAMTFLMASPLVSESVIIVMAKFYGLTYMVLFVVLASIFPILFGVVLDLAGFGKYLREQPDLNIPGMVTDSAVPAMKIPFKARLRAAEMLARTEVKAVLPYIVVGLLIGGAIHGFVPQEWIVKLNQTVPTWLLIPLMAVVGSPLYLNMAAAVPVAFALTEKGLDLGAVMAFLVAGAGMSIPEMSLLSKLFKKELLGAYVLAMLATATGMGYLFSYVF